MQERTIVARKRHGVSATWRQRSGGCSASDSDRGAAAEPLAALHSTYQSSYFRRPCIRWPLFALSSIARARGGLSLAIASARAWGVRLLAAFAAMLGAVSAAPVGIHGGTRGYPRIHMPMGVATSKQPSVQPSHRGRDGSRNTAYTNTR